MPGKKTPGTPFSTMKEIFRRLSANPVLAAEILAATFFSSLLTLAMPLYVIQILGRYITYGFHGTLITLTMGVLIAVLLQFCFRVIRTQMATAVNQGPNDDLSRDVLTIISRAKADPLSQLPKPRIQEILAQVQTIQQTYDAQTLNAVLDAPFSLIFVSVIYLMSPLLAGISLLGIGLALFLGWITNINALKTSDQLMDALLEHRELNLSAVNGMETVRAFSAAPFLYKKWDDQLPRISRLRNRLADYKELAQTLGVTWNTLTSVLVYALGAVLVVRGELTVSALIGVNILSGRAFQNSTRIIQINHALGKAGQAFKALEILKQIPLEPTRGTALDSFTGRLQFKDLAFTYPRNMNPVFESVNLHLEPGKVLAVHGENSSGKTTLAKLLAGLLEPRRGSILVDGVNLLQIAPAWWRKQIMYMPQEPVFIQGTLRENILLLNPNLPDDQLNDILKKTDLRPFLDKTSKGLETPVTDNEKNFPPGIRQRISLARAMASTGSLAILDEPTNTMDQKGIQAVYAAMNSLAKSGKTIIVFSNDPNILKGASLLLNLNRKPVPELSWAMPAVKPGV